MLVIIGFVDIFLLHNVRLLLEKLIVTQQVKKFPAFYGSRRFITVFTRASPRPCVTHHNKLFFFFTMRSC
jgi:hypothetical protein